jgi:NitT/TauT family transport system ATP-binding protein
MKRLVTTRPMARMTDDDPSDAPGRVEMSAVSVAYATRGQTQIALAPTDLLLKPGTFTALIGPSGCGKSTLLNVVAGFVPATAGGVAVDNRQVTGPDPSVGVTFQSFALFPWFTALANVEFPLKRFRLSREERRARAMLALAEVGLKDHADKYPGQLSGGMKQRVAIARTFASDPAVLLMDEPFGALDAQTRLRMQELLMELWLKRRKTVLFVTHDVDEALRLADLVCVMTPGPGRIAERIVVDLPRPRAIDRMSPNFLQYRAQLLELLRHDDP